MRKMFEMIKEELREKILENRRIVLQSCCKKKYVVVALMAGVFVPDGKVATAWDMVSNWESILQIKLDYCSKIKVSQTIIRHICLTSNQQSRHKRYFEVWLGDESDLDKVLLINPDQKQKKLLYLNELGLQELYAKLLGEWGIITKTVDLGLELEKVIQEQELAKKELWLNNLDNLLEFLCKNTFCKKEEVIQSQFWLLLQKFTQEISNEIFSLPEKQRKRVIEYFGLIGKKKKIRDLAREDKVGFGAVRSSIKEAEYQIKKRRKLHRLLVKMKEIKIIS